MPIYEFEGRKPVIAPSAFIHPQAIIIGDVSIGENCYIGALAVLRGDYGKIKIGSGTNIQELCMLHIEPESEVIIEDNCLVGHSAIIHGPCIIGTLSVIGMGSLISSGCEIKEKSMLAAGSVLPPGKTVASGKIAMGNPAREVKDVDENMQNYNRDAIVFYQDLAARYHKGLKAIEEVGRL